MKYLVEDRHHATIPDSPDLEFVCPKCGIISQEDVFFLCNHCEASQLVLSHGIYMCPSCLREGENFQCMKCNSKEVKMRVKDKTEIEREEKLKNRSQTNQEEDSQEPTE